MRKNIVAGNWKMNKNLQEGIALPHVPESSAVLHVPDLLPARTEFPCNGTSV
jgi:hypothetical protein